MFQLWAAVGVVGVGGMGHHLPYQSDRCSLSLILVILMGLQFVIVLKLFIVIIRASREGAEAKFFIESTCFCSVVTTFEY